MATNFRILVHRNSDSLHMKLLGDFDGSSACELLNMLKKNSNGARKVFIHTNCLKHIHPFGRDTFCRNLRDLKGYPFDLLLTGEKAERIAPLKGESSSLKERVTQSTGFFDPVLLKT